MKKYELFSEMSHKLEGMLAINSNPLTNPYCQAMSKNPLTICHECYSQKMLKGIRRNCIPKFERVGAMMSKSIIPFAEIPVIKDKIARFSAHGELINMTHLHNCVEIAKANPRTTWGLWTKKFWYLNQYWRKGNVLPDNIVLIYSNPYKDTVRELPKGFNKIFNVYSKEYAEKNNIEINCGAKRCLNCKLCYAKLTSSVINEIIK